jgi:transposase-like protein
MSKRIVAVCLACGCEWSPKRIRNVGKPRLKCPNCRNSRVVLDIVTGKTPKWVPI